MAENSENVQNCINESEDDISINDIDLALYKYSLIYRYDINNNFDTELKKQKQKSKYRALCVWLIFNIFRAILCWKNNKNGKLPVYYFDILQYVGGIAYFCYLCVAIGAIMGFVILKLLNIKNGIHFGWLDIIQV